MEEGILFFVEEIEFVLDDQPELRSWMRFVAAREGFEIGDLNYVFVSDEALAEMNMEHLQHDTYTDILTFPLNDPSEKLVAGDIYISVERVIENAKEFEVKFRDELHRVMVHGLLHMMGHDDLEDETEAEMRKAEDFALSLRRF